MATSQRLTADACIALSIDDLLDCFYEQLAIVEDDEADRQEAATALYFIAGEIFERLDIHAARRELVRSFTGGREIRSRDDLDDDDLDNLRESLAAMERRQAARLLRETFDA
jgi:hypothetical protein